MCNFLLIGVGGYIAPRHLNAIKSTGGNLLAALDPKDSVGIIDRYFPDADFFTEFERFDRHAEKLKQSGTQIDYVSICSPNYLHDAHIRFALRIGADAICEKPLVLNPWNIDALKIIEREHHRKIYNVLQLRLHPRIRDLKEKVSKEQNTIHDIDLKYITPRGRWYYISWKGNEEKSGGIATNIGVHFFDMLLWIFGGLKDFRVYKYSKSRAAGSLKLERANVNWMLSVDRTDLPADYNQNSLRSLTIDGEEFDFSDGFTELHTHVYKEIINGRGFGLEDVRPSIDLVHKIRELNGAN